MTAKNGLEVSFKEITVTYLKALSHNSGWADEKEVSE
jgi:hypothetical protein